MNINPHPHRLTYVLLLGVLLPLCACQSAKSQAPQQAQISKRIVVCLPMHLSQLVSPSPGSLPA